MPKSRYTLGKDGYYHTTLSLGYAPDGKTIKKYFKAHTISELENKIQDFQSNAIIDLSSTMAFSDYAQKWIELNKPFWQHNTLFMYQNALEKHILPEIGFLPIDKIDISDLQTIINKNINHPNLCRKIKLTLNQIFKAAITEKIITYNPVLNLRLPNLKSAEKRPLTEKEKKAILECKDFTEKEKIFVKILYYCGLRRGECLALNSSDIDLKDRKLRINKALYFDDDMQGQIKEPKTTKSIRFVPIPSVLCPELINYLSDNKKVLFGKKTNAECYMSQSSYTKFWNGIVKKIESHTNEIPPTPLTAHIFRHNYATLLYYSNVSLKQASELLGHSNTKMIMDIYAHIDSKKENIDNKINDMFS